MISLTVTIFGWFGMVMLVIGFYLISNGSWNPRSIAYQTIQCIGCVFVTIDSLFRGAYPAAFLQIVVIIIAAKTINDVILKKAQEIEKMGDD